MITKNQKKDPLKLKKVAGHLKIELERKIKKIIY